MTSYPVCDASHNATIIGNADNEEEALRIMRAYFAAKYPEITLGFTWALVFFVLLAKPDPVTHARGIQAWVGMTEADRGKATP
jgi:hypothetical protein